MYLPKLLPQSESGMRFSAAMKRRSFLPSIGHSGDRFRLDNGPSHEDYVDPLIPRQQFIESSMYVLSFRRELRTTTWKLHGAGLSATGRG
ncbi:hypothetical protein BN2475_1800002 [Paraburkholderia ribeironis]|uniref:Uncharacterized protein n=1 Tax=Paraburkholderia ribeironis TaxID=1247936 RepID=A0A1N7SQT2_9BURK|nr:hypothetical protein BN2475_1800002 [Paraburkholderia ribeironis]